MSGSICTHTGKKLSSRTGSSIHSRHPCVLNTHFGILFPVTGSKAERSAEMGTIGIIVVITQKRNNTQNNTIISFCIIGFARIYGSLPFPYTNHLVNSSIPIDILPPTPSPHPPTPPRPANTPAPSVSPPSYPVSTPPTRPPLPGCASTPPDRSIHRALYQTGTRDCGRTRTGMVGVETMVVGRMMERGVDVRGVDVRCERVGP